MNRMSALKTMRVRSLTRPHSLSLAAWAFPALLFFLAFPGARSASANCDSIPAGKSFWIRLLDPVASYSSKPGTSIRATLIQSPECDSSPVFPAGLEIDGKVVAVRKVGLGFLHETAFLDIQFSRLVTASGAALPIAAQVVEIDNGRETVRHGIVRGVLAANSPQGRITSGLIHLPTYNPYGGLALIIYRSVSVLPEPEIYLPPGTDIRLQLTAPIPVADQPELPHVSFQLDEYERGDIELLLQNMPERTTTRYGKDADLVNLLFVGSQAELQAAFTTAGWRPADRNTPRAFFKQFAAFLTYSNYPNMPVTHQLLNGQPQDLVWQKSFNSYGKREHVRIWSQKRTVLNRQAWLSAYTRETSAAFSLKNHNFIHHIDRNLDDGVNMLVRDLTLSGCVDSVQLLPRPDLPPLMLNSTGDYMSTDGMLTVVHLKACDRSAVEFTRSKPIIPIRPRSRIARYLRSQMLLYKSDVIRGNILYGAFDLFRLGIQSFRHHGKSVADDYDSLPLSPVSPETLFPQIELGYVPVAP